MSGKDERSSCFYVTISENFEHFQYFNFKTDFLENENFFQKTGLGFFKWTHEDWKGIISIQNCNIKSQCWDK